MNRDAVGGPRSIEVENERSTSATRLRIEGERRRIKRRGFRPGQSKSNCGRVAPVVGYPPGCCRVALVFRQEGLLQAAVSLSLDREEGA